MITRLVSVTTVCVFASTAALATEITAIPRILDADTIAAGADRIRLSGVDAPESDQICLDARGYTWNCGVEARDRLEKFGSSRPWTCRVTGSDSYGRYIGVCRVNGEDVSRWLVRNGWALAFRRYSSEYLPDEETARSERIGLWAGAFIAPWEWRQRSTSTTVLGAFKVPVGAQRLLISPKLVSSPPIPSCSIKANLGRDGCIYHIPGEHSYSRLEMNSTKQRRWFCTEAEAEAAGCRKSKR